MFTYEYLKSTDIFNNIKLIKDFSINELILLWILLFIFIISVYLLFPILYFCYKYIGDLLEKRRKKHLLKQIALEKEIEEKIQKEIEQH